MILNTDTNKRIISQLFSYIDDFNAGLRSRIVMPTFDTSAILEVMRRVNPKLYDRFIQSGLRGM